jgi:hypothetical protein
MYTIFSEKHSTNIDAHIHALHSSIWTHTPTLYPYEHLRKTELADWILKLIKSPQPFHCRREHYLPLNEYSSFMRHTYVKPRIWTLVSWGYNQPPSHPTSGWFSMYTHFYHTTNLHEHKRETKTSKANLGIDEFSKEISLSHTYNLSSGRLEVSLLLAIWPHVISSRCWLYYHAYWRPWSKSINYSSHSSRNGYFEKCEWKNH